MPILVKPFLFLIAFGPACWLLMMCVRAISLASFTWRFKTATHGRFQNQRRLSISEETPNEDQRPLGPVLPGLRPSGLGDGPNDAVRCQRRRGLVQMTIGLSIRRVIAAG